MATSGLYAALFPNVYIAGKRDETDGREGGALISPDRSQAWATLKMPKGYGLCCVCDMLDR